MAVLSRPVLVNIARSWDPARGNVAILLDHFYERNLWPTNDN